MKKPTTDGNYIDAVYPVDLNGKPANSQSLGMYGSVITTSTTAVTGNFCAIQVLVDNTNFASFTTSNITGSVVGLTLPSGTIILGTITGYSLSSGAVIAYKGA